VRFVDTYCDCATTVSEPKSFLINNNNAYPSHIHHLNHHNHNHRLQYQKYNSTVLNEDETTMPPTPRASVLDIQSLDGDSSRMDNFHSLRQSVNSREVSRESSNTIVTDATVSTIVSNPNDHERRIVSNIQQKDCFVDTNVTATTSVEACRRQEELVKYTSTVIVDAARLNTKKIDSVIESSLNNINQQQHQQKQHTVEPADVIISSSSSSSNSNDNVNHNKDDRNDMVSTTESATLTSSFFNKKSDDQIIDANSILTTAGTSLTSDITLIGRRTCKDSVATTNAATALLQVASSTENKKRKFLDNNHIDTDQPSSTNLHHEFQQKINNIISGSNNNNIHSSFSSSVSSKTYPLPSSTAATVVSADKHKFIEDQLSNNTYIGTPDDSTQHPDHYHRDQPQKQRQSTSATIPKMIRRDSLPMGLRNKKMRPTDCLLFAATLLEQEVTATDNTTSVGESSISVDDKNCTRSAELLLGCKQDININNISMKNEESITKKNLHHHNIDHTVLKPLVTSSIVQVSSYKNNVSTTTCITATTEPNTIINNIQQQKLVTYEKKKSVAEEKKLQEEVIQQQLQQHPVEEIITINGPKDADVLCGRGGKVNKHPGNIVYRKVVDYNKSHYQSVHKKHRILVSKSIVQAILNHGGRFMGQKGNNEWIPINFKRAVQKTSQALREHSNSNRSSSSSSSSSSSNKKNNKDSNNATGNVKQLQKEQILVEE